MTGSEFVCPRRCVPLAYLNRRAPAVLLLNYLLPAQTPRLFYCRSMQLLARMRAQFDAAHEWLRECMSPDPRRALAKALIADMQRQNAERTMMHVRLMDILDEAERRRAETAENNIHNPRLAQMWRAIAYAIARLSRKP